jgi:hypothetical protein
MDTLWCQSVAEILLPDAASGGKRSFARGRNIQGPDRSAAAGQGPGRPDDCACAMDDLTSRIRHMMEA